MSSRTVLVAIFPEDGEMPPFPLPHAFNFRIHAPESSMGFVVQRASLPTTAFLGEHADEAISTCRTFFERTAKSGALVGGLSRYPNSVEIDALEEGPLMALLLEEYNSLASEAWDWVLIGSALYGKTSADPDWIRDESFREGKLFRREPELNPWLVGGVA